MMTDVMFFGLVRFGRATLVTVFLLLSFTGVALAQIVPASRRTTWQGNVGVPGGIPNRTIIYQTLNPGATAAQIEAAINNCPSGQVVQLAAGTYNLTAQIRIYNKDNWTLRGAGMGKTILTGGGNSALALGRFPWINEWPAALSINSGYAEGSTNIALASTAGVLVGKLLFLEQDNDSQVFGYGVGGTGSPTYNSSGRLRDGNRVLSQIVLVTGINGNNVSFTPALNFSFAASQNPKAIPFGNSLVGPKNAGIEDLTISGSNGGMGVWWMGAYGCWMKNVELTKWGTFGFEIQYSVNMEVRGTYIHEPYEYNWSKGYSLQFDQANNCLIEDNIFWKFQDGIILQSGCSGNVIAYNCLFQSYPAYNGIDIMLSSLFGNHTPYPLRNLFEGNFANGFHSDFYYGPSREFTLLRNYFTGSDPDVKKNRIVVNIDSNQKNYSVVGNILGSEGTSAPFYAKMANQTFHYTNTTPLSWIYDPGSTAFSVNQNVIFRLGYPYIGNNGTGTGLAAYDSTVRPSTIIHGNYDHSSKTVKWDPNIPDQNIPNSYYLTSKPAWFGSLAWPPFNPAMGASMTPMSMVNIPAGYRFIYGTNPPSGPVNNPPVATAQANTNSGGVPLTVTFSSAGSVDPEGATLTYNWTFGDGTTSALANPTHTYQTASNFVAQLRVSDGTNTVFSNPITITVYNPGSANSGLVAAYGFEEGSGGSTLDSSGNNNSGGLIAASWGSGKFGTGVLFNNSNAVVVVNDSTSLDLTTGMTLQAWVYPTAAHGLNIIYKDNMSYFLVGSTSEAQAPGAGASFSTSLLYAPNALPLNTWSHVAATHDGATLRFYVNGTQVSSRPQTGQINPTTGALMIGGNSNVPGKNWLGRIDEVRIYNRALSASEILSDMNTPVTVRQFPQPPTNLRIAP